jgi:hypothetical protein
MKIKKQKGFSLLNLILMILFFGFFGIIGFQIGMGYLDQFAIKSAVKQSLIHAKNDENIKEREIVNEIIKKIDINSIDLKPNNIYITKNDEKSYNVEIEYKKEINLTKKIKIVMNLNFSETSN